MLLPFRCVREVGSTRAQRQLSKDTYFSVKRDLQVCWGSRIHACAAVSACADTISLATDILHLVYRILRDTARYSEIQRLSAVSIVVDIVS